MSVLPSMVHRSGDTLVVRSVVSGDPLYEDAVSSSYASTIITDAGNKLAFYIDHDKQWDDLPPSKDIIDLPECKVKRNYSCATCDYFTQNPRKYLYHLRDVHREKVKVYECPSCLYASKHYQKLLRHTRMVHGRNATVTQDKNNLKISSNAATTTSHSRRKRGGGIGAVVVKEESFSGCDEAIQTSPRPPADDEEQDEEEEEDDDQSNDVIDESVQQDGRGDAGGNVKFRCALCSFVAKGQQQLTKHESEVHIRTKFFRCTKCSYVTHIKARYTKHVKYHSMPMIKCDLCDFRTPYKWNLDRHCKNHNGRGAFRCSACNFTADIKQSLTVHEMNHHVPPVGQAAMAAAAAAAAAATMTASCPAAASGALAAATVAGGSTVSVSRRRNKVGASDSVYAAENQVEDYHQGKQQKTSQKNLSELLSFHNTSITTTTTTTTTHHPAAAYTSADFVHPDDIVERPNGHIYLKSQCKFCNFKTAYETEMVKHERTHHSATTTFPHHHHRHHHHSISIPASCKPRKTPRPVPNLIPIRSPPNMLSAKELHDITIGSSNSALKDYAPLFDSEELFRTQPPLQPVDPNFKEKNASFFDKLKEKLLSHDISTDLICQRCGHESKCWTESVSHLKMCGKEMTAADRLTDNGTPPLHNNNNNISSVLSSTRCQYCRQRCKSSADLYIHMQTCAKYQQESELFGDEDEDEEAEHMEIEMRPEDILSVEEQQHDNSGDSQQHQQPHPMENRVFVWNDIEVPMNIGMDDVDLHQHQHQLIPQQHHHHHHHQPQQDQHQHHHHQPQQADLNAYYNLMENALKQNVLIDDDDVDAVSLDLSIRTQSPVSEATPPHIHTKPTKQPQSSQNTTSMFGKVPTHGNDISIAQHKRVFKCPHCSFWASTASRFHVHIVGHLNKKPFECSLCAYRSNWRWDITKHIKLKSVRDPNHETARVLMTDETGRRNYTKYNKYLTEINIPNGSGAVAAAAANTNLPSKSKQHHVEDSTALAAITADGKNHHKRPPPDLRAANSDCITVARFAAALSAQAPPRATQLTERDCGRKRALSVESTRPFSALTGESRRPMYKCSKYIAKDSSAQEKRAEISETHYTAQTLLSLNNNNDDSDAVDITCQPDMQQLLLPAVLPRAASGTITPSSDGSCDTTSIDMRLSSPSQHGLTIDDSMAGGSGDQMTTSAAGRGSSAAPFSCGHCHQRHCRLKHHGNISVIVGGRVGNADRVESDRQTDEPEHLDIPQLGAHKCPHCPYSTDADAELAAHAVGHVSATEASLDIVAYTRCPICGYTVGHLAEIYAHLPLHGIGDPVEYMQRVSESDPSKRHKCTACPYVTNSKSQYLYHKRFHKPKNGQYKCSKCNYNVTRRHLLHQHMKVHSVGKAEYIDLEEFEELSNSGAEMPLSISEQLSSASSSSPHTHNSGAGISADIPLIWVSRGGNFSKMYKCRHCPHVNSRKVNIQEHEKMHVGSSNAAVCAMDSGGAVIAAVKVEGEHHCTQCDYVCNNAGVLSSHIKVHQGAFGILHCLVDPQKSDEDQIRTLTLSLHQMPKYQQQQLLAATGLMIPPPITSDNVVAIDPTSTTSYVEEDEVLEPPTDVNLAASLAESGDMLYFCHKCPARFLKLKEFEIHRKLHGGRLFYKCNYCTYTGRQRPHLNAHAVVHTTEYKKRTANLRSIYRTHPVHTAPAVTLIYPESDYWVVAKSPGSDVNTIAATSATATDTISAELDSDTDINDNNIHGIHATDSSSTALTDTLMSATRNALTSSKDHSVPLSGTDLFRHRQMAVDAAAENRMRLADSSRASQTKDNNRLTGETDVDEVLDQFGDGQETFGVGNPNFIYPMCTKNGRQKEKRYKCAKCPTAFEKREQYKVHLGLHGSKQRFQCEECDYSVANSSNFVQHQRKHVANNSAVAASAAATKTTAADQAVKTSVPIGIQQQIFRCPNCPYNSRRRDAVDNHLKRHASVSGVHQAHACAHCDYSVAQAHILRDHVKMHFASTEVRPQADAFLSPDVAVKVKVDAATKRVLFDDNNDDDDDRVGSEADISDTVVGGDCDSNGTKDNNGKTVE